MVIYSLKYIVSIFCKSSHLLDWCFWSPALPSVDAIVVHFFPLVSRVKNLSFDPFALLSSPKWEGFGLRVCVCVYVLRCILLKIKDKDVKKKRMSLFLQSKAYYINWSGWCKLRKHFCFLHTKVSLENNSLGL